MMRVFADCGLTADNLPTESCHIPHSARVSTRNSVGGFRLIFPTHRLDIGLCFQHIPSVGSRQVPPYSYGVMPPPDMAADSTVPAQPTERGQHHA